MARNEEEEEEQPRKKKKGFWTKRKILIASLLIIGIVLGAALQYYIIDPLLEPSRIEQLSLCKAQNELLNQESQDCLNQLHG